jgi:hypothetical protein
VLDEFVARAEANPAQSTVEHLAYRETKRYLAEHDAGGVAKPEPGHLFAKSEFFRRSLPPETIAALVEHIAADRRDGHAHELDFTPWGGAYNRVAPTATAFAHRAERFLLKHEVVVDASRADAATAPARAWLERSWDLTHAGGAGGAYPNFPDAALDQWDRAYHKGNRDRLLRIRARYDPDGVFS